MRHVREVAVCKKVGWVGLKIVLLVEWGGGSRGVIRIDKVIT